MYPLKMLLCEECHHVYNEHMRPIVYDAYPMYNLGWSRHVGAQADFLSTVCPCKKCVEIGGGDCKFLEHVATLTEEDGYCCIDPAGVSDKFTVYPEFSTALMEQLNPDTVILRHTLEHFLNPKEVLENILESVQVGTHFFIEVPNVETTLERKWFCDYMPEHPQNFSRRSLATLAASVGLKLSVMLVNNSGTVLTLVGVKDEPYEIDQFRYVLPDVFGFDFGGTQEKLNELLKQDIIFWGAAGKSTTFLNHFYINQSFVYDSDERKVGKFVPGTGQKILGIKDVPETCNKVFATSPWRANDIRRELTLKLNRKITVYTYSNDEIGTV